MSDQHQTEHTDHIAHHVKRYLLVFVALILGTIFTVWASYIHFPSREINIAVALVIASCKAFLVAGFFMHLVFGAQNDLRHYGFHRIFLYRLDGPDALVVRRFSAAHCDTLICR